MSRTGWAAFAAMSVLWGGSYLLIEIAERDHMAPIWVAWLRICVGAVALLALAAREGSLPSLRGHWRWLIVYALVELIVPWPLVSLGETHVPSSLTAIIIAAVPLFTALLGLRLDPEERPTRTRALGLGLGFAGVVVLVGLDLTGSRAELLGAGEIIVAPICYAAGVFVLQRGLSHLDPRATMGACLGIAAVTLAPFALTHSLRRGTAPVGAGAVASVIVLGLVCTAAALVIFAVLIREAGTGRATVFTYVNPVVALVLGVTLEGELAGGGVWRAIGGLALILAGSWLATAGPAGRSLRIRRRDRATSAC